MISRYLPSMEKVAERKKQVIFFPCTRNEGKMHVIFLSLRDAVTEKNKLFSFPDFFPVTEKNTFFSLLSLREKSIPPKGGIDIRFPDRVTGESSRAKADARRLLPLNRD